ncbi:MAG: hypothetical protein LCH84_07015 [Gemmatimonadetes bacterium]|nr:hypothetical protein [Gemmatimonadota bacterium]
MTEQADAARVGLARWLTLHDDLLRGLAHALGNRLGTVTATASILEAGRAPDPRLVAGLQADAGRLEGLLEAVRMLPLRVDAEAEPLLVTDAIAAAERLVAEHPLLHDRQVALHTVGDIPPVRVPFGALVQACAVVLLAGARVTAQAGGHIAATLTADAQGVCFRAGAHEGAAPGEEAADELLEHDARAIDWLLGAHGGVGQVREGGCLLTLPPLVSAPRA